MTREPATPAELHAAMLECAESSVAMYEAKKVRRDAEREQYRRPTWPVHEALTAAEDAYAAAKLRHRNATTAWLAIRPEEPK